MSQSHHEELSAFIDGALGRSEQAFLLRRLQHDDELRGCFERYHLIGDCLRGRGSPVAIGDDLAGGVRKALADESAPGRSLPWRGGMQWAAGLFTAAIVAAGAFWSVQPDPVSDSAAIAQSPAASEVQASGVRVDDLRRQLPLLPVSARQSRPLTGAREFAPQPDPEAWQQAPMAPLPYPSTHYIILVPRAPAGSGEAEPQR